MQLFRGNLTEKTNTVNNLHKLAFQLYQENRGSLIQNLRCDCVNHNQQLKQTRFQLKNLLRSIVVSEAIMKASTLIHLTAPVVLYLTKYLFRSLCPNFLIFHCIISSFLVITIFCSVIIMGWFYFTLISSNFSIMSLF